MAALKFGSQCAESDMRGWRFLRQCEPTLIAGCGLRIWEGEIDNQHRALEWTRQKESNGRWL